MEKCPQELCPRPLPRLLHPPHPHPTSALVALSPTIHCREAWLLQKPRRPLEHKAGLWSGETGLGHSLHLKAIPSRR